MKSQVILSLFVTLGFCSAVSADSATVDQVASAQTLVEQALRAEAAGDMARRTALLDEALRLEPDHRLARWHSGQIQIGGVWRPIGDAQKATATDPRRSEYELLREANGASREGQLGLARWCRANGFDDEAKYHWTTVLSHDPQNEEALRALGARWYEGRLMSYAEIESAKARTREMRHAVKKYASQVARWKRLLSAGDIRSRDTALAEIRALRDADGILAVERVTLAQNLNSHAEFERAMQMGLALMDALAKMPGQAATESLLRHAGLSTISDVRKAASDALKGRPQHDYIPHLLAALAAPIESSFRVATDADGSVHYWHSLYREGQNANWVIEGRSSVFQHDFGGSSMFISDTGEVVGDQRESDTSVAAKKTVVATQSNSKFAQRATGIEQEVARMNQELTAANARVVPVLQQVTDQEFGNDPKAWWEWWDEHNDYYSSESERPTYEQQYVDNEVKYYREPEYVSVTARHSCFAAGTMVWTNTGLRAIETLEIGDFVLAQDTTTGELAYKPVMGRTVRPARKTLNVRCGNDVVQATPGHPMWVSGVGWKMAKELNPGDVLHGSLGPALVESVEPAEATEVFNLIVADWQNYFVGEAGVLVHDNSPRKPTSAKLPGLTQP